MTSPARRVGPFLVLSRALHCTHGQAYTLVVVSLTALTLTLGVGGSTVPAPTPAAALPEVTVVPSPIATQTPAAPSQEPSSTGPSGLPALLPLGPSMAPVPRQPSSVPTNGGLAIAARVGHPFAPGALALSDGHLYVGTDNGTDKGGQGPSVLFRYGSDPNHASALTVSGQGSHARGVAALTVLPDRTLVVADAGSGRVLTVDPELRGQRTWATLPDLPTCGVTLVLDCEPGAQNHPPTPTGLAADGRGGVYIADAGQATVWHLARVSTTPEVWFQDVTWFGGSGPTGLARTPDGGLDVTVGSTLDPSNLQNGGLYHLAVAADGTAPTQASLVASFAPGDLPGPLVVAASGTRYVVLLGTQKVVTVTAAGVIGPLPAASSVTRPTALVLGGRQLLIASSTISGRPKTCAVTAVPVPDIPTRDQAGGIS